MKKLQDFSGEEIGEEWLRELYKVVAMRRSSMFRLITESVRLVLFGNGGGAALVIGFMSASSVDATTGLPLVGTDNPPRLRCRDSRCGAFNDPCDRGGGQGGPQR